MRPRSFLTSNLAFSYLRILFLLNSFMHMGFQLGLLILPILPMAMVCVGDDFMIMSVVVLVKEKPLSSAKSITRQVMMRQIVFTYSFGGHKLTTVIVNSNVERVPTIVYNGQRSHCHITKETICEIKERLPTRAMGSETTMAATRDNDMVMGRGMKQQ
ncbi:hypothetical protein VNO77_04564 [Canavalia gladiata]|uniref:Uncharacterized protein n=1 Tax=Canavalia gladiata TaxID=3824 RepID=A0AAN9R4W4_CANGL